jgi:hypothetical protein
MCSKNLHFNYCDSTSAWDVPAQGGQLSQYCTAPQSVAQIYLPGKYSTPDNACFDQQCVSAYCNDGARCTKLVLRMASCKVHAASFHALDRFDLRCGVG